MLPVIVKKRGACVMLFLPTIDANLDRIVCYERVGQHSEASMEYFKRCRPIKPSDKLHKEAQELLEEYRLLGNRPTVLKLFQRDNNRFKTERWELMRKEHLKQVK